MAWKPFPSHLQAFVRRRSPLQPYRGDTLSPAENQCRWYCILQMCHVRSDIGVNFRVAGVVEALTVYARGQVTTHHERKRCYDWLMVRDKQRRRSVAKLSQPLAGAPQDAIRPSRRPSLLHTFLLCTSLLASVGSVKLSSWQARCSAVVVVPV